MRILEPSVRRTFLAMRTASLTRQGLRTPSDEEPDSGEAEGFPCPDMESQSGAARQSYTRSDFCAQCRAVILEDFLYRYPGSTYPDVHLQILRGSTCPLCRFFDAVIHASRTSTAVSSSAEFCLPTYGTYGLVFRGYDFVSLEMAKYRQSHSRFILPLDYTCKEITSQKPSPTSENSLHPLRQIPYEPPNPYAIDFELVRTWISVCREKHRKLCREPETELLANITALPSFRVIDCSKKSIVQAPTVFEYVALSYVWGQTPISKRKTTIPGNQPTNALPLVLPKTIEDAMVVVVQLGFKYLWVDKYCIDQSTNQHELLMQLSSMDMIYDGASVTIVAAAGSDAEFGLPGVGERHRVGHPSITIDGRTWVAGSRDMQRPVSDSKWITRGWTYQEAHFSRRLLTFTDEQVLFECSTCRQCESMRFEMDNAPNHSTDVFRFRGGHPRSWLRLSKHIELYTQREMTNQSDALNALRGLFASFSKEIEPTQQFWGLPISPEGYSEYSTVDCRAWGLSGYTSQSLLYTTLAFGLTWHSKSKSRLSRRNGFPSWSWSGWTGPVRWWPVKPDYPQEEKNTLTHVEVVRTDNETEELTAQLAKSIFEDKNNEACMYTYCLRIEAEILQIKFDSSSQPGRLLCTQASRAVTGVEYYWKLKLTSSVAPFRDMRRALREKTFDCIVLNNIYGLVVYKKHGKNERLGRISLHGKMVSPYNANKYADYCRDVSHLRTYFPGSRRTIVLG